LDKKEKIAISKKEEANGLNLIKKDKFLKIFDDNPSFIVIDQEKIDKIVKGLETTRIPTQFMAKSSSQLDRKLVSTQMLYPLTATYHVLKELLALIERKKEALRENYFKLAEKKLKLKKYEEMLQDENLDNYKKELYALKRDKIITDIASISKYYENAIKEMGALVDAYNQIIKNKGLENFTELDMEKEEYKERVMLIFRQAFRELIAHGTLGMASLEGFEHLGIHPLVGFEIVKKYHVYCIEKLRSGNLTFDDFVKFLKDNAEKFQEHYEEIYKLLGIDTPISEDYVYKVVKNKEQE